MDPLFLHRLQFGFTASFHYLFPQVTMGLALLVVVFKVKQLRGDAIAGDAVRFWSKILGLTFVMGVVTGIPLEFQFGTNWSRFSEASGGVVAQTLAMEGVFAFFLESTFLYALLFGEKRFGPKLHFLAACLVFAGTWLSGWFIICTNAFMQHPVGHRIDGDVIRLADFWRFFLNPWAFVQYAHAMMGTLLTASHVVVAVGALYLLRRVHEAHGRLFLRVGIGAGLFAAVALAYPTGDYHARMVHDLQPVTFAAMEGHFRTEEGAGLVLIGQPDMRTLTLDNPVVLPNALSVLTHKRWTSRVVGLRDFDRDTWPDAVPLLYYSYHVMVGLGTILIGLLALGAFLLVKGRLYVTRGALWALMLTLPFPFIANTAGWLTAELGRQPWVVHGIMRTAVASSPRVSDGNVLFTLLGFMGLYALLAMLYFALGLRILTRGPGPDTSPLAAPHAIDEPAREAAR